MAAYKLSEFYHGVFVSKEDSNAPVRPEVILLKLGHVRPCFLRIHKVGKQLIDLVLIECSVGKIESLFTQRLKLSREVDVVPFGLFVGSIVREPVCRRAHGIEVSDLNGDALEIELLSSEEPGMANYDHPVLVDHERLLKPK